jgi:hypothetical protein
MLEPNKPDDMVLRSDVWGIFRSTDGGKNWVYGCAELYGSMSLNADHKNMLVLPGGRILVASGFSGLYLSDELCTWHQSAAFSRKLDDGGLFSELVQDVQFQGDNLLVLTATGVNGKISGKIWKSTDKGDTWTVTGGPLPTDFAGTTIGIPPSAPTRIYASGRHIDADGVVLRSDDNGMTWTPSPVPSKLESASMRIGLIHPTNPDIFFVWADQNEGLGQNSPDEIYATKDGGKTFILAYDSMGDLPGLALSPDNTEVLVAGPLEGIYAAKLDDIFTMGKKAFTQRNTGCAAAQEPCPFWGLNWTKDGLYAGTNDFSVMPPRFTFGVSKDAGKTFMKLMDLCDVKFDTTCAASTNLAQACQSVWDTGYSFDYTNGPRCMPDSGSGSAGAAGAGGLGGAPTIPTAGSSGTGNLGGTTGTGNATSSGAGGTTGASGSLGNGGTAGNTTTTKTSGGCSYSPSVGRPAVGLLALVLGTLGLRARRTRKKRD